MNHVGLVAGRELGESFRSKGYWVTMGFLVLAVIAALVLPRIFGGDARYELGVSGDAPEGVVEDVAALAAAFDVDVEVRALGGRGDAERAVREEVVGAALHFDGPAERAELLRRAGTSETLAALARQAAVAASVRDGLLTAGLSAGEAAAVLATPPPAEVMVDDAERDRGGVAYVISFLLYLALFTGGMGVATGVAIEKSTRIAEVLVTTLRPSHLLAGKVLGIGAATLLLLLAPAVPFLVAMAVGAVDVPTAAAVDVVAGVGWFFLGYAVYATGFAALGALVDRQEDLGGAVGPFSALLILSFFAAIQAQAAPNSTLAVVTSLIPFSAPLVMPVRIAQGAAGPAEIAAAVAIGVGTFLVLVRVGGTIYQRALLRGGRRLKVAEVLRG